MGRYPQTEMGSRCLRSYLLVDVVDMFLGGSIKADVERKGEERGVVGSGCAGDCGHDWAMAVRDLGDERVLPFAVRKGYRVSYVSLAVLSAWMLRYMGAWY